MNSPAAPGTAPPNTVSWQSVFFGLATLALNAMTQRSLLDVSFPSNSLLFAMRSSPFICIADSIESVVVILVYRFGAPNQRNGLTGRTVNLNVDMWLSNVEGGVGEDTRRSVGHNNPHVFLILFVGTATQAVKILGFKGMVWTKLWAVSYLVSYVAIAVRDWYVPSNWRQQLPRSPQYSHLSPLQEFQLTLSIIALTIHFFTCSWTIYQIWHVDILSLPYDDLHNEEILFITIIALLLVLIGVFIGLFLILSPVGIRTMPPSWTGLIRIHAGMSRLYRSFGQRLSSIFDVYLLTMAMGLIDAISYAGLYTIVALQFGLMGHVVDPVVDTVVQGLCLLVLCGVPILALFQFLFLGKFAWSGFLMILPMRNPDPRIHGSLITFALMNFVVAFLYYSIRYDSEGTVKPDWTEKLG